MDPFHFTAISETVENSVGRNSPRDEKLLTLILSASKLQPRLTACRWNACFDQEGARYEASVLLATLWAILRSVPVPIKLHY